MTPFHARFAQKTVLLLITGFLRKWFLFSSLPIFRSDFLSVTLLQNVLSNTSVFLQLLIFHRQSEISACTSLPDLRPKKSGNIFWFLPNGIQLLFNTLGHKPKFTSIRSQSLNIEVGTYFIHTLPPSLAWPGIQLISLTPVNRTTRIVP